MKQTAVEWLVKKYHEVNWLRNRDEISSKYADELREVFFYQAKEMEKQQQLELIQFLAEKEDFKEHYSMSIFIAEYFLNQFKNK